MSKPTENSPDFVDSRKLNWGDMDSGRMAYTGRFLDWVVEAVEHWFTDFFEMDWYDLNEDLGYGTPFRQATLSFQDMLTPRDVLETEVRVTSVGDRSINFFIEAYGVSKARGRRLCFTCQCTIVFVNFANGTGISIPPEFRAKLEAAGMTGRKPSAT